MFFEKLKKKIAVLKCHTHLGKARIFILNYLEFRDVRELFLKISKTMFNFNSIKRDNYSFSITLFKHCTRSHT